MAINTHPQISYIKLIFFYFSNNQRKGGLDELSAAALKYNFNCKIKLEKILVLQAVEFTHVPYV